MDIESLAKELILKNMNPEQQLAVLEGIKTSVAQAKEVQKQRIGENVGLVVDALKKIESDIRSRYDEVGTAIEQRVNAIKDGRDGINGQDGKNGKDGLNGKQGVQGIKGKDGRDGRDGVDGIDGVSVTSAHIDFDGSLIIGLSSGVELNVGEVLAPSLAESIKVITNGGGTSQSVIDTLASLQTQITNLIPSQTGNSGKFLTTNGTSTSWSSVAGGLSYQGTWNASTNTPTLTSSVGTNGYYYIVATAGSTNLNGITDWQIGDWLMYNGTIWQKIDQSNTVTSVNGQTGAVSVGTVTSVAAMAGTGITVTGSPITSSGTLTITNSAPDQTVVLTGGTGITTSGTYPSFTITNSSPDRTVALTGAGTTSVTGTYPNFTITSNDTYVGTVTSVTGTSPVVSSGGATPAISLATAYGDTLNPYASKTANYVLAAPNGSAGAPTFRAIVAADIPTLNQNTSGSAASLSATLAIASGGTGQTTANTAFNALAPSQTSNSGKYLTTDGTNSSWATVTSGSGTVTSVAATVPTFLSITGSPITTSGTLAISYSGTALPVLNGGTGVTTSTGTGANVLGTSPTITTPTISSLSSASATALTLQSAGTNGVIIDTSQNLQFNSGYGSVATAYGCRAWVNFNGTGTVSIRGSANVSSITDNGTGDYTVNFTTSMVDANYSTVSMGGRNPSGTGGESGSWNYSDRYSTSSVRILCITTIGNFDQPTVFVAVFR